MSDFMNSGDQPTIAWTEGDWYKFSEWIRGVLMLQAVTVTFLKANGDERVMTCTLAPALLPVVVVSETAEKPPARKRSDTSLPVYDLTAQAWRSFTIKNVTRVQFSLP